MTIRPNTKKIIYISVAILPIIIIGILGKPLTKKSPETTKVVIPKSNSNSFTYKPNNDITNPSQAIKLNLSKTTPDIKTEPLNLYEVVSPLVSENLADQLISNLNFYDTDKIKDTPQRDHIWINDTGSLFLSTNQNQIVYTNDKNYKEISNSELNNNEIVEIARKHIQTLLGQKTLETLSPNPLIQYIYINPSSIEVEAESVEYNKANLIVVSFSQTLNSLPVVTNSPNTEIIRLTINKNKKLADLRVYGGFLTTKETKISGIPSLENFDSSKLHRLTYSEDISSEKLFLESKNLTLNAEKTSLAYYYQNNDFLVPVILLRGSINANKVSEPATYIYPIISTPESL